MKQKVLILFLTLLSILELQAQTYLDEGFDNGKIPENWLHQKDENNTRGWLIKQSASTSSIGSPQSGTHFIEFESYDTKKNLGATLTTPMISETLEKGCHLQFYSVVTANSNGLHVDLSTNGGASWTEDILFIDKSANETQWTLHKLDLSSYLPKKNIKIRFRANSSYSYKRKCCIALDQIKIFKPKSMAFESITAIQENKALAPIGIENEILKVKISTSGALNPMNLNSIKFNTLETSSLADIAKAKLYYTGNSPSFSKDQLVEEISDITNELNFTTSQELKEGENYFFLAYEIKPSATAENKIDAQCISATINSAEKIPTETNPIGDRTLKSILLATNGLKDTVKVTKSILFTDDGAIEGNVSKGLKARLIFEPALDNQKVQIDFSQLNFATMKIYNGKAVDSKNQIEYITGSSKPKLIKSTSSDGCLTIDINGSSYSTYKGWVASVSNYTPKSMEYVSSEVSQISPSSAAPGSIDVELFKLKITTQYLLAPKTLNSIKLKFSQATNIANISKIKVYYHKILNEVEVKPENLVASVESITDRTITIPLNKELVKGNMNNFKITLDIANNATDGNEVDATLESVKFNNIDYSPETANFDGAINIKNMFIIKKGSNEFTIKNTLKFYDHGGPDADYTKDFTGVITFKPKDASHKLKIKFNSFATYYSHKLTVYNGSSTSSPEIATLSGTSLPSEIKSTANDGSLTFKFYVSRYSYSFGSGWDALISNYQPNPMSLTSVEAFQNETGIIKSGDKKQQIIGFKISTKGMLNPKRLENLNLNLEGTSSLSDIEKIQIFYGKTDKFNTDTEIKELSSITDFKTAIVLNKELEVGDNYFWVCADISESAKNDNTIDAKIENIRISGSEHIPTNNNPSGNRVIKNIYEMAYGTKTIITSGGMFYDDGGKDMYYGDDMDATLIFKPKTNGNKIKVEFLSFKLQTRTYSGGYNDFLAVYDGNSISAPLIGKYAGNDSPEDFISSAADGSVCFKFKSNSWTEDEGWEIRISEYSPQPMRLLSYSNINSTISDAAKGSMDVPVAGLNIKTEDLLNPISVKKLKVDTKNSESISKIKIYYTGKSNSFSKDSLVAEKLYSSSIEELQLSHELIPGDNFFWICYDVSPKAKKTAELKAECIEFSEGDNKHKVQAANLKGVIVSDTIKMPLTIGNSILISDTIVFTDDGGALNNFNKEFNSSIIFESADPDKKLKIDFLNFALSVSNYGHSLTAYNGKETEGSNTIAVMKGSELPAPIKSTAKDGALRMFFKPSSSYSAKEGWIAKASLYTPRSLFVESVQATQSDRTFLERNSKDQLILGVKVNIAGEKDSLDISQLAFSTLGCTKTTDILKAKLYYTNGLNKFTTAELLDEVDSPNGDFSFTLDKKITREKSVYFWLCYDIANDAQINDNIDASVIAITSNKHTQDIENGNPIGKRVIRGPLAGEYSINPDLNVDADFINPADACKALNKLGVVGKVTFKIADGEYEGVLKIDEISGVNNENTVSFESASEDADKVVFSFSGKIVEPTLLTINGADYLSFKNITFKAKAPKYGSASHGRLVEYYNQSNHLSFINNKFIGIQTTSTDYDNNKTLVYCGDTKKKSIDNYTTFKGNYFEYGTTALYISGISYVSDFEKGLTIQNNRFSNQYHMSLFLWYQNDVIIDHNSFILDDARREHWALRMFKNKKGASITNNKFNLEFNSRGGRAIMLQGMESIENSRALIANNMIYTTSTGSCTGISLEDAKSVDIAHNTIKLDGTGKYSKALFFDTRGTPVFDDVNIVNNIFAIYSSSYAIWSKTKATNSTIDFNDYYSNDNSERMFKYGDVSVKTIEEWRTKTSHDAHSITTAPTFNSNSDLHVSGTEMKFGTYFSRVEKDIDSETRNAATPFIGADEIPDATFNGGYPKFTDISSDSINMKLKSTKAGEAFYVLLNSNDAVPTIEQIRAGKNAENNPAIIADSCMLEIDIEKVVTLKSLSEKSDYSVILVVDKGNKDYSAVLRLQFTTLDVTAPKFTESTPKLVGATDKSIEVEAKINELGTIYYGLYETQVAKPSVSELKNGLNSVIAGKINSLNQSNIKIEKLSPGTDYNLYLVAEDAAKAHNIQKEVSLLKVKTLFGNAISNFKAESVEGKKAVLTWKQSSSASQLMIACSKTNEFSIPENGKTYHINDTLTSGADIIYLGNDSKFEHLNLDSGATYFYRAYTFNQAKEYSQYVEDFAVMTFNKWTILVYMDADNNLEPNAIADINEMEAVNIPDSLGVNIIVQIDRNPGYDYSNGNWTDTRRYKIKNDNDSKIINSTRLDLDEPLGELNMGDPKTLSNFVEYGMKAFPSEKTMVIMWDHGGGWRSEKDRNFAINKGVCWDDSNNGDYLEMREVKSALEVVKKATNRKIDILGFDVCLAGMIEVAYQVKEQVKTNIVASQALVPGNGWDYTSWLDTLRTNPGIDANALSIRAASTFKNEYNGKSNVTMSVFDIKKADEFTSTINDFVTEYTSKPVEASIINSAFEASNLFSSRKNYIDLGLFFDYCATYLSNKETKAKAKAVVDKLDEVILYKGNTGLYSKAKGLNIYFHKFTDYEWKDYKAPYCDFADQSIWKNFVENYDKDGLAPLFIDGYPKATNLSATIFDLNIKANKTGLAYYVVQATDTQAPTKEQIKEGKNGNGEKLDAPLKGEIAIDRYSESKVSISKLKANSNYAIYLILEDEKGKSSDTPVKFTVKTLDRKVATLESLPIANEAFYNGADNSGGYTDGSFNFPTHYTASFWSGFGYSNRTDINTEGIPGQFTSMAGSGAENSKVYGVAYVFGSLVRMNINDAEKGIPITGMYVTNNSYSYHSMKKGDAIAKKFGGDSGNDEDWFKLTIKGIDAQGHYTGSVDFYLADYRFKDNAKDYILESWKWVDLSSLGNVVKLEFRMSSSDNGVAGMNTPGYFCFDNVNGVAPVDQAPYVKAAYPLLKVAENSEDKLIDLNSIFADDDSENIEYSLVSNNNSDIVTASLSANNLNLSFTKNKIGQASITIRATADGKSVESTIELEITREDLAPEVINEIDNLVLNQANKTINLNDHFSDPNGDVLNYSIISNSNEDILKLSIQDSILKLETIESQFGNTTIRIQAEAKGKTVTTEFSVEVKLITGVEELMKENKLLVYPIPTNDFIYVESNSIIQQILLVDMRGTILKSRKYNSTKAELSLSDLSTGVYFLKILFEDKVEIKKILKSY